MDLYLQRIMNNAADGNASSKPEQALNYAFVGDGLPESSFQSTIRQPDQDSMLLTDLCKLSSYQYQIYCVLIIFSILDRDSYSSNASHPPLATLNNVPNRLSLLPRNGYAQPGNEPRTITNPDNHFRFARNLRQGLPVNNALPQPAPMMNDFSNQQGLSPLTQLANNMLLQRPMPLTSPEVNFFHGVNPSRLKQLQPRRQESTPPFNLSKVLPFSVGNSSCLIHQVVSSTVLILSNPKARHLPFSSQVPQRESAFGELRTVQYPFRRNQWKIVVSKIPTKTPQLLLRLLKTNLWPLLDQSPSIHRR